VRTETSPFRLSLHVGDVGHTLIAGPTGVGKSVLLALQFCCYPGGQISAIDFDRFAPSRCRWAATRRGVMNRMPEFRPLLARHRIAARDRNHLAFYPPSAPTPRGTIGEPSLRR
jgi:hypothetical protein